MGAADDSGSDETVAAPSMTELGTLQTQAATHDHIETLDRGAEGPTPPPDRSGPVAAAAHTHERGASLGRYVVLDLLGAGGMGEVYAAYDPELDRKVALKVLRPGKARGAGGTVARARLLREAQAMAKLSHPNVISVFDVGTIDGDVYVAMEFVEGSDLRGWLDAGDRTWAATLANFRAAAEGLAAAHDVGLIHRDFKPDNVLLGADGRVRVIDFGLARQAGDSESSGGSGPARDDALIESVRASMNDAVTTKTGAVMGTPAYMAPEQFFGSATDHRTDQFNFCASLYEGLYGRRAFEGDTMIELMENVTGGRYRSPPADADVPAWIVPVLKRGLAREPDDRYASMADLIAALEPPVPRWAKLRVPLAIGAAVVVFGGLAAFFALRSTGHDEVCRDMDSHLAGVWDDARKAEVKAAVEATELPYAADVWQRVEARLDDYTTAWVAMRTGACEATSVRKEQTAEMLELRMACLDNRLREVDALAGVLAASDGSVVERAPQAVQGLSSIDECADRERLLADPLTPPPEQKPVVDRLETDLARVKALQLAGKYDDSIALARSVLDAAREAAWRPAEARALFWIGDIESRKGQIDASAESLFEAIRTASAADDRVTEAMAWITAAHVVGLEKNELEEGARWIEHGAVAIERAGGDPVLGARLAYVRGHILARQRKFDEAIAQYEASIAAFSESLGADHWRVAASLTSIASVHTRQGHYEKAVEQHRMAIDSMARAVGADHPQLGLMHHNLGNALSRLQRFDEAKTAYDRALELKIATYGENHVSVSRTLMSAGRLRHRQGDFAAAEALYLRGIAARRAALGTDDHGSMATARGFLQALYTTVGRTDDALSLLEMNLAFYAADGDTYLAATAHARACFVLVRADRYADATPHCAAAVAALSAEAKDPRELAYALIYAGMRDLGANRPDDAVAGLERALEIFETDATEEHTRALAEFSLARALVATGRDIARARALATTARGRLTAVGKGDAWLLPEVDAWLAAQQE